MDRYPGGMVARDAAIDAGARRPFAELAADIRDSASRLEHAFEAIAAADAWERPTEHGDAAAEWVFRRWREVEVHRVDLAADYTPDQWPALLVTSLLPESVESLPRRVSSGAVRVVVTADGSVAPQLVGREWSFGTGAAVDVRGPDWAVLAWLTGRPAVAAHALSATPALGEWR